MEFERRTRGCPWCLLLCDNPRGRESLARLLYRYIQHRYPQRPLVLSRVSADEGRTKVACDMAVVLHTAARRWLGTSPFDNLDPDSLSTPNLERLISETIRSFHQSLVRERWPTFVVVLDNVTESTATQSTLSLLRRIISAEDMVWIVFAPRTVCDISDPLGSSPFYNIFSVHDLSNWSGQRNPQQAGVSGWRERL